MKKGFTILELLVVIAIIGLFASVALAGVNSARIKARNAKRADDFQKISQAIERYMIDNNDYPPGGYTTCQGIWSGNFDTHLSPYLPHVPVDPLNKMGENCNSNYYYAFWNPTMWNIGGNCPSGSTILYQAPTEGEIFRDDCNVNLNTIIFKK